MRRLQTIIVLVSIGFLINSCERKFEAASQLTTRDEVTTYASPTTAEAAAPADKKGPACCTVSSRTKGLTK